MSLKFLNKKGWHTQSMANQARLFEARAKETARKKAEEEREAELRQVFAPRRWCSVRCWHCCRCEGNGRVARFFRRYSPPPTSLLELMCSMRCVCS
jgi:hypothetical protein